MSRFVDPNVANKLTGGPGNIAYMTPEAHLKNPSYTIKLDIFSYGVFIVHSVIGKIPQVGDDHCLYPLVVHCLHDKPNNRPTTEEVHTTVRELCGRYPNETLLEAAKRGDVRSVRMLLEGGADPNMADQENSDSSCLCHSE